MECDYYASVSASASVSISIALKEQMIFCAIAAKDFSEHAIRILQLQAEGMTIRQIAQTMRLAETTIKYHAAENYRKLNVKGKTDAVQKAKSLKII